MSDNWPIPNVPKDEQRTVRFQPAFHRCHTDPSKDYGIGSVRMVWVLRVEDWAMTWDVHTGWGLPGDAFKAAAPDCDHHMHRSGYPSAKAMGGAVVWHSPVPRLDGDTQAQECCPITGTACYLDSGFMLGSELFELLRTDGDEAVWKRLRDLLDQARAEVGQEAR